MAATETEQATSTAPPRDNLIRATFPAVLELREIAGDTTDAMPTMTIEFARYGDWYLVDSMIEGRFMERVAPGAFTKTIQENSQHMRVLFNHGHDPQIGDKVLGPISELRDSETGPVAEVPLLATSYNHDLIPALRAGLYGSSYRFKATKDDWNERADVSDHNPLGLPERTIQEAKVMEFGPVTWPANPNASAGVRSLAINDRGEVVIPPSYEDFEQPADDLATAETEPPHSPSTAPDGDAEGASRDTPADARREPAEQTEENKMSVIDEMRARQAEISRELQEISTEHRGEILGGDTKTRFDDLNTEWDDLEKRCDAEEERAEVMRKVDRGHIEGGADGGPTADTSRFQQAGTGTYVTRRDARDKTPDDVWAMNTYHERAQSGEHLMRLYTEGARRASELIRPAHARADRDETMGHIEHLLKQDSPDKEIAQRILGCGSPTYRSAYWKTMMDIPLNSEERASLSLGASGGAFAVPIAIDPTVIPTSSGALNPFRQISKVVTTTAYQYRAVTASAVTAQYRPEGTAASDNTPTLYQPTFYPERVDSFIPFSQELGQDWGSLETELAGLISDAKDLLEAQQFWSGAGHASNAPAGLSIALTVAGTLVKTALGTAFSVGDVFALEASLAAAPRHLGNASWMATPGMYARVRQLDTAGGASLWTQLAAGNPQQLLGYPAYKCSTAGTAGSALTATALWGVLGDFQKYQITDRIGLSTRVIPDLFSGNTQNSISYPMGMSGLFAFWRNTAGPLDTNAFRIGTIATGG